MPARSSLLIPVCIFVPPGPSWSSLRFSLPWSCQGRDIFLRPFRRSSPREFTFSTVLWWCFLKPSLRPYRFFLTPLCPWGRFGKVFVLPHLPIVTEVFIRRVLAVCTFPCPLLSDKFVVRPFCNTVHLPYLISRFLLVPLSESLLLRSGQDSADVEVVSSGILASVTVGSALFTVFQMSLL